MSYQRKTKIVATVGPASESKESLIQLAKAGVNVFRLNFSHGTHEDHLQRLLTIREISKELDLNLSILQDLQGPKIRTQLVENNGVVLEAGKQLIFAMDENLLGTSEKVGTTYTSMYLDVNVGERILMDDGNLEVKVISIDPVKKEVVTEVIYGGILKSKKGINLPGTKVSLPCLTPKDEADLYFGLDHGVDWIALSFVRKALDTKTESSKIIKPLIPDSGVKSPFFIKGKPFRGICLITFVCGSNIEKLPNLSTIIMLFLNDTIRPGLLLPTSFLSTLILLNIKRAELD